MSIATLNNNATIKLMPCTKKLCRTTPLLQTCWTSVGFMSAFNASKQKAVKRELSPCQVYLILTPWLMMCLYKTFRTMSWFQSKKSVSSNSAHCITRS